MASWAASSNSLAVLSMKERPTPAVTPFHWALSDLAFMPLLADSASSFSFVTIAAQSVIAVWSGPRGAFITFSYVSTCPPPYLRSWSILEDVKSACSCCSSLSWEERE